LFVAVAATGTGNRVMTAPATLLISNVCFPAGTPITTDQGNIPIEKINPDNHTIRNKKIISVTQSINTTNFLICFEKHALGNNIPSQKTRMTKEHEIFYKGKMVPALYFIINKYENVYKVKYNGEILYNVLLENHDKMLVNNLICETLSPENNVAKLYNIFKTCNFEEKEMLIKEYNKIALKKNKFTEKQLKMLKNYI